MKHCIALWTFLAAVIGLAVGLVGLTSFESAWGMEPMQQDQSPPPPWFTGTLLSTRGRTVDQGHLVVQPYVYYTRYGGVYTNNWRLQSATTSQNIIEQTYFIYGVTDRFDIELCPQWLQNYSRGETSNGFGDLSLQLGFQAVRPRDDSWAPSVRLWVQELFPTGRFTNLHPGTSLVDATGGGSFATTFGLGIQKPLNLGEGHVLRYRFNVTRTLYTSVSVTGFNAYGGGFGTDGHVAPGQVTNLLAAAEFTLTRHWGLALDISYQVVEATRFSGTVGISPTSVPATVGRGSGELLSLAPAVEYHLNGQVGLIAGPWFSVLGRNTSSFLGGVAAIYFFF
ncbi:MAG: hypothetical protein KGS09_19755 [Nitrospirae bacterium]|nr:hypothetical protein [Nitrospirota bacterium]